MLKTLIVDDNASFRHSFREHLCRHVPGIDVVETGTSREALEEFTRSSPDLVFIDIDLAGESGLELTKKIREHYTDTPIAILTNYDLPEYRQAAFRQGADCYIPKSSATCVRDVLARVEGAMAKSFQFN